MIEVPPPTSPEYRWLRWGTMTCREYIWFRSKWNFLTSGIVGIIAIWEFTLPYAWSWVWGVILIISTATNVMVALNWRQSWRFWHDDVDRFFERQESLQKLQESYERLQQNWYAN